MPPAPVFEDPVLARIAETTPLPAVESTGDVFHDLMSCLVEQQIHTRSTKRTFARSLEAAGLERVTLETVDRYHTDGLSTVRLSGPKQDAIARTVAWFRDHEVDWPALDDEAVRATLGQIRGVGPWTVDMVLLYTLGRPDVFPVGDYHLKQVMASVYDLEDRGLARQMRSVAEAWRPHRSHAVRVLLAWKDWQREMRR